jgi:DNA-binding NarL/FixJ family response regulator
MSIRAKFDFVSTAPQAVAQRKAAIQNLASQGLNNRDISKQLGKDKAPFEVGTLFNPAQERIT